jgi:hypothetical protein
MRVVQHLRSGRGRIARGVLGLGLIWAGARSQTATGLFLLTLGLVPLCTAIANISLFEDVRTAWRRFGRYRRDRANFHT